MRVDDPNRDPVGSFSFHDGSAPRSPRSRCPALSPTRHISAPTRSALFAVRPTCRSDRLRKKSFAAPCAESVDGWTWVRATCMRLEGPSVLHHGRRRSLRPDGYQTTVASFSAFSRSTYVPCHCDRSPTRSFQGCSYGLPGRRFENHLTPRCLRPCSSAQREPRISCSRSQPRRGHLALSEHLLRNRATIGRTRGEGGTRIVPFASRCPTRPPKSTRHPGSVLHVQTQVR